MSHLVAFAAEVIADQPSLKRPKRVQHMGNLVTAVRNPATGFVLWVPTINIVNVVHGVAAIHMRVTLSNRWTAPLHRDKREVINRYTGNTFLVYRHALVQEGAAA